LWLKLTGLVGLMVMVVMMGRNWRVGVSSTNNVQWFIIFVIWTRGLFILALNCLATVSLRRQHCLPENTITLYTSADWQKNKNKLAKVSSQWL
jgi:hypothetical protein